MGDILQTEPLVLFDGVCNLCSASVQFLARYDRFSRLWYAPVQSAVGQNILAAHNLPLAEHNSFILIENGQLYTKSDAFLRLCIYMDRPFSWLRICRLAPRLVRDWIYDRIARNRYRLFGKKQTCMVPRSDLAARFLG